MTKITDDALKERFCQQMVQAPSQTEALRRAEHNYSSGQNVMANKASKMMKADGVKERIEEIKQDLKIRYRHDVDRCIQELSKIAFANKGEIMIRIEQGGIQSLYVSELSVIKGVKNTKFGTDYVFEDKMQAIDKILKLAGAYEKHNEQKIQKQLSPEDSIKLIQDSKLLDYGL